MQPITPLTIMPSARYHLPEHAPLTVPTADTVAAFLRQHHHWWLQYTTQQTRYEGWYLVDAETEPNRMFKLLERIVPCDIQGTPLSIDTITVTPTQRILHSGDLEVCIQLTDPEVGISIRANRSCTFRIFLDTREIYANPVDERVYRATRADHGLALEYSDPLVGSRHLHLHFRNLPGTSEDAISAAITHTESWIAHSYPWDAARNSEPATKWVLSLPLVTTEQFSIGAGWDARTASYASERALHLQAPSLPTVGNPLLPRTAAIAYATQSLAQLRSQRGWYAGLPWFHQIWTRDELLAGLGMTSAEQLGLITKYSNTPTVDGELPTFAGSGTTCADGVGLLALLVQRYGLEHLPTATRNQYRDFLLVALDQLWAVRRAPSGLFYSGHDRTWMDTIGRSGFRIEIQAMLVLAMRHVATITANAPWSERAAATIENIRHSLWQSGYLADGLDENLQLDTTKRPNVFLAYLAAPEILSLDEWQSCCDIVLAALHLPWGGLSSIDTADSRYHIVSTGEDNHSYHNGDSWHVMNALALRALRNLNPERYQESCRQIEDALIHDVLSEGFLGSVSEIVEAGTGSARGCGDQAFSAGPMLWALEG
jgi:hypothetical protein